MQINKLIQVNGVTVETKYVVGLDLGQVNDYTALVILERSQEIVTETIPVPDYNDDRIVRQWTERQTVKDAVYHCRHIERLRLGTPYPDIIDHVKEMVARKEINGRYMLVVDQTGVGRPVFDMVLKAGLDAVGVTITGGDAVTWHRPEVRVAKRLLVSTLQAVIQTKRLQFAGGMQNVDILQKEMLDFRVKISDSANDLYSAREGQHDDLVLSLALALWMGEKYGNPQKKAQQIKGY